MISLSFEIIPEYLAYYAIANCSVRSFVDELPNEKVVDFQNAAWAKDRQANDFLRFGYTDRNFLQGLDSISEISKRAERLIKEMLRHETFKVMLAETEESMRMVEAEWNANFESSYKIVSELSGLELKGEFKVVHTHPALKQGCYLRELNAICWAYRNTWKNYNTVYLWHELLHGFLAHGSLEHAAIQFITDNELRVMLDSEAVTYPPFEGHKELEKLMEMLFPHWQKYLGSEDKNIGDFIANVSEISSVKTELSEIRSKR